MCSYLHAELQNVTVQADLNGDGTDEVLVSTHGTTIQAGFLPCTASHLTLLMWACA